MRLPSALAVCLGFFAMFTVPSGPAGGLGVTQAEAQQRVGRPAARPVVRPGRPVARPVRRPRPIIVAPVRPIPVVRPWFWGRVVAGVTIGAIIAVAVAGSVPKAPSPTVCWFWTDYAKTHGYWDYCVPPVR
ncbi:MAG: hypothetical protein IOC68_10330 [Methylobacterium sp.]|nr:hypothetical protein [Methylobacterium sp.]MCA3603388.1 hypothetical protein [Methylobacterium sp.]MCA3606540.1 hypothetical protein [Methylobacterium sp.]MCA3612153.1 hypothetical protein [Methylobacterium sp.]MCA3619364.1 hypothetical protein [Methylobacterium sp.]